LREDAAPLRMTELESKLPDCLAQDDKTIGFSAHSASRRWTFRAWPLTT